MFPKLEARVRKLAEAKVVALIDRLSQRPLPAGIQAKARREGVLYSGRRLLARFITDPLIRSFLT